MKHSHSARIVPKKSLGQHFLVDDNISRKIVASLSVVPGDVVVELGPGTGALTRFLMERGSPLKGAAYVIAVELDPEAIHFLSSLGLGDGLKLVKEDMLKLDFNALSKEFRRPLKVVSNLPYNISGPMLARFFDFRHTIDEAILMLQKEVAQRVLSPPGKKTYGVLSVLLNYGYWVEGLFQVPRGAFRPIPKVDSMVIRLRKRESPPKSLVADHAIFKRLVRKAFQKRRKKVRNALFPFNGIDERGAFERCLEEANISPDLRPEDLSVEDFVDLANVLYTHLDRSKGS